MKNSKLVMFLSILLLCTSCTESKRVFMQMNEDMQNGKVFTSAELLEKATYFTQQRDYNDATLTISLHIIPQCEKENNQECLNKTNALLCKIYQDKIDKNETPGSVLNAFYRPDLAKTVCKKAGIKIMQ